MIPRSIYLLDLTSTEVRELVAAGYDTVIQGFGAVEAHGPHLPLGTDCFEGEAIVDRAARRLERVLVAPALRLGCSQLWTPFAGTIAIRPETLAAIVLDVCRSYATTGFRYAALLATDFGTMQPLLDAIEQARREVPDLEIAAVGGRDVFMAPFYAVGERHAVGETGLGHAGHGEVSMMLALDRTHVREDRMVSGVEGTPEEVAERRRTESLLTVAPDGALGSTRGYSREAGEDFLDAWAEAMVRIVDEARNRPR
jgi:creatinine amidohydrolase